MPRHRAADRASAYYPAFLDVRGKRVVVVGGGAVATRKVHGLLPCSPEPLIVVAPHVTPSIQQDATEGRLTWWPRPYADGDLAAASFAIAASDDRALNARVAAEARRARVLVLAVDDIPNCDVIAPATVLRGALVVAISTGGRSPALARWVRQRLEQALPRCWGERLEVAAVARERLGGERGQVSPERWQAALDDSTVGQLVHQGRRAEATEQLLRLLREDAAA